MRDEVIELARLGVLPSEEADEDSIRTFEEQLMKIHQPVSDEEAAVLIQLFGPDDCFGLGWQLLHLIESAPGGAPLRSAPGQGSNVWLRHLWARSQR